MSTTSDLPIPLLDDCFFIDNSSMEYQVTCPRSAEYYILRRRELNRTRSALEFGKIIHKALEARYLRGTGVITPEIFQAMLSQVDEGFKTFTPDENDFRNYDIAISALQKYSVDYAFEPFQVWKDADGKPAVELPFAFPLGTIEAQRELLVKDGVTGTVSTRYVGTITVVWKGKIDLIYTMNNMLYGLDHKTTSIMGPQFFQEFELSHQVHGYSWAIRQLTGKLPSGFTINGLGIRKPTKSGKALEFIRHTIPIFSGLVAEWEKDSIHIVSDFIEMASRGYMPKHTKWCQGKYGACQYKQVCLLPDPSHREIALGSNEYRDVTWDPLKE